MGVLLQWTAAAPWSCSGQLTPGCLAWQRAPETVFADDGARGTSTPETGVSAGKHEAAFLLDGGDRYGGLGVRDAARQVNDVIGPAL